MSHHLRHHTTGNSRPWRWDQKPLVWRAAPGYEGRYQVSSAGHVRNAVTGRVLQPHRDKDGYLVVRLYRGSNESGRAQKVHRLVCSAWHGPCPEGHEVAHLNGRPGDNRFENLAWATPKENNAHKKRHGTEQLGERAVRVKLTKDAVRDIWLSPAPASQLAKKYAVTKSAVKSVRSRQSWSHYTSTLPPAPGWSHLQKVKAS